MPLFEYKCNDCGKSSEILMVGSKESSTLTCSHCGSENIRKMMTAHSSLSGVTSSRMPGVGDTTCCGSRVGEKSGCAGPGTCCGKNL